MPAKSKAVPVDTDGDGIVDEDDACPNEPEDFDGFADEDGCPDPDPDRDGDGVIDRLDNCPDEPGPEENQGCPEEQQVVIEESRLEIMDKIYFNVDSADLQRRSHAVLDNVAEVLNVHPEISLVRVEGHTDSTGSAGYNLRLSQRRVDSVVRYLVDTGGVSNDRLAAEGFGETRPLVPNAKTKAELAQNRRVEFHIAEGKPDEPDHMPGGP
ncbi:MAG: OmpA family protein [Polyangiales bacterium]